MEFLKCLILKVQSMMQAYEINTPLRICHFLAQVAHESKFQPRAENLNYSPRRMREIYGCRRGPSQYDASQDSEIPSFLETQIIPSVRLYKRCCFR